VKEQSTKRINKILRNAMADATPVKIRRSVEPHESLRGIVLGLSDDWALFAGVWDSVTLDGFNIVRRSDIIRARHEPLFADYLQRHNVWPPKAPEEIDLTDVRSVITTATASATVAAIYREAVAPGKLLIGFVSAWRRKSLRLRTIDTDCTWEDFDMKLRLRDVTQVSFGGAYDRAVLEIAGPFRGNSD
jgi:hypothetical protein